MVVKIKLDKGGEMPKYQTAGSVGMDLSANIEKQSIRYSLQSKRSYFFGRKKSVTNKQTGQYVDDCQIFIRCTEWDINRAQALQKVLHKGSEVRLETAFNYTCATDNNGQPRVYFDARFPKITVYPPRPLKPQQQQTANSPSNFDDFGNSAAWGETAF